MGGGDPTRKSPKPPKEAKRCSSESKHLLNTMAPGCLGNQVGRRPGFRAAEQSRGPRDLPGPLPRNRGERLRYRGQGEKMTEFYWKLATRLFTNHRVYGASFADARASSVNKAREPWVLKVKNEIGRFVPQIGGPSAPFLNDSNPRVWLQRSENIWGDRARGDISEEVTPNAPLAQSWGGCFQLSCCVT